MHFSWIKNIINQLLGGNSDILFLSLSLPLFMGYLLHKVMQQTDTTSGPISPKAQRLLTAPFLNLTKQCQFPVWVEIIIIALTSESRSCRF